MGTFTYQWADEDGDITGATSSTYTVPSCDGLGDCTSVLGKTYSVTVVHTDAFSNSQTMDASAATSAITLNPDGDLDGDTLNNSDDTDDDGDGWIDSADTFPSNNNEWVDTDGDGIGNNADTDDDQDGVADTSDDFPLDSTEQYDADGDGWGHNADADDDGDGIEDTIDTDDDGDGEPDATDAFPNDYNEWVDTDGDGIGNNADTDDDGDLVDDTSDAFPLDSTETVDTDGDGTGDNADTDDDGDGYSDADESTNCGESNDPLDATDVPTDTDGDMSCNALDDDDDGDGVVDASDAFPLNANEVVDTDGDCGTITTQTETSGDGCGDASDTDDDGDGIDDTADAFPLDVDAWTDTDGDGLADDFPNLSVTTWATTSTDSISGSFSVYSTVSSFTLESGQRAIVTITNSDGYPSECLYNIDSAGWVGCYGSSGSPITIATAGAHTVQLGDSFGDGGNSATIEIQTSSITTPATSPAGTTLDNDDDGDNVLDANENAGCSLIQDCDGDGDNDDTDQFPLNPAEWDDTDGDAPSGSDGTGYGDNSDAFPNDACANVDTDGDGYPDDIVDGCTTTLIADIDDDGDGVLDNYDDFDTDATESTDTDDDGIGNNADTDDDGDGWNDLDDWAPLDENEWLDTDGDLIGDNSDSDDDGDGIPDGDDTYPRDFDNDAWDDSWEVACGTDATDASSTPSDYDADSSGDSGTVDSSGVPNGVNLCDTLDTDDDNDGYLDADDAFDFDYDAWADTDGDGKADTVRPDVVTTNNVENFDSGSAGLTFVNSGTHDFTVSSATSNSGSYALIATTDQHSETATVTLTIATYAGTVSFNYWTQVESSSSCYYDWMTFKVDGVQALKDCGTSTAWESFSTTVTEGTHTFEWEYDRDSSWCSAGSACTGVFDFVAIDDISLPTSQTIGYPTVTAAGTPQDFDDDDDSYSDLDETTNCDDGGAYGSTSDPLDDSSTPADMDGDLTCDALDSERDGDGYNNDVDAFPDDSTEWVDTDGDLTGNNADTDDDNDGTLDVDDVWSLVACAADDFDGDGKADTVDWALCELGYTGSITHGTIANSYSSSSSLPGLNDGDYAGVTDYTGDFGGANTGDNYYAMEDTDGTFTLTFDYVTADSVSLAVIVESTGWETADYLYIAFVGETSTVVIYDSRVDITSGDLDDSGMEDIWTTMTGDISGAGTGYLMLEMSSNSADEEFGFDTVVFTDSAGATVAQTDFEQMGDAGVGGYYKGGVNTASINYGTDSNGNPIFVCSDGIGSFSYMTWINDNYNDCADGSDENYDLTTWFVDGPLANTNLATVSYGGYGVMLDSDDDNDGYHDWNDAFSLDGTEWVDTDADGTGNNADLDDDNDGVFDIADAFPLDLNVWVDTDGDGMADSAPPLEAPTEYTLTISDSWGDGGHEVDVTDSNGNQLCYISSSSYLSEATCTFVMLSGTADVTVDSDTWYWEGSMDITSPSGLSVLSGATWASSAPTVVATLTELSTIPSPTETPAGTMIDNDDDNDGYTDDLDACPTQGSASFPDWMDNDGDGLCDNTDTDDDNDGYADANDVFPMDATEWVDADGDGTGDNADLDDDNDSVLDVNDAFPFDECASVDTDLDGRPDTLVANCSTVLVEDMDDDNDLVLDTDDAWPLDATKGLDTDGDGIADDTLDIQPGDLYDFESGVLTNQASSSWVQYYHNGYGNTSIGTTSSFGTCGSTTVYEEWEVTNVDAIAGAYSLRSGQVIGCSYAEITAAISFYTSGGDATWDWKVSSIERTYTTTWTDGLKVFVDGVQIDASQYGGCMNGEWCGETSGSMSWPLTAGNHTLTFMFDFGTGSSGGTSEAWIDNLQLPFLNYGVTNDDLDDDNDGVLDENDIAPLDLCISTDTDGDGLVDDVSNDPACDPTAYAIDDDDDNDVWSDSDEVTCGSDSLDNASVPSDNDGDMVCDVMDLDDDNDGTEDSLDAFPMNNTEDTDTDMDGIGNNADTDDDGDGIADLVDAFPLDGTEYTDTDGDGTGDNSDDDIDNDGYLNDDDAFPMDIGEWVDTDSDGIGNNEDTDDDGDGFVDLVDQFPLDASESLDSDGDGVGDNTDDDDDGDLVNDDSDAFPLDPFETVDTDGDGQGDNSDADDDGDGINDGIDQFPMDSSEWIDSDGDGIGDNTDNDDDGDDVADADDAFPLNPAETSDYDGDGVGDNADTDDDGDSEPDVTDDFPFDITEWKDTDSDGTGDNADTDDDDDGISDSDEDACGTNPLDAASTPKDSDGDGDCDAIDDDFDPSEDAPEETDTGFANFRENLPGFTSVISTLALLGAAIGVGLSGRRKND